MHQRVYVQLARIRLDEANLLLAHGKWSGAYYLAGYSVECALKAAIAKQMKELEIPDRKLIHDVYSHKLDQLLSLSKLRESFEAAIVNDVDLDANWNIVGGWTEQSRYRVVDAPDASGMVRAAGDPKCGMTTWILSRL